MIGIFYLVLFLVLLFISFMILLKTLDIFYLKTFFKTIVSFFLIFFSCLFPFVSIYCLAKLFSYSELIVIFETSFLGNAIITFFKYYFIPLYIIFIIISIIVMILIILGRFQKQTMKPIKVLDGPNVVNDNILIKNKQLSIRSLTKEDVNDLLKWLTNEKVLEFHDGRDISYNEKLIYKHYFNDKNIKRLILLKNEESIGYLQYYPITKAECNKYGFENDSLVYGIDYFIGVPKYFNRGYQVKFLNMIKEELMNRNVDYLVVDPLVENEKDIKNYEKCGFKKYRLLPNHRFHEGERHDCYLMIYSKDESKLKLMKESEK